MKCIAHWSVLTLFAAVAAIAQTGVRANEPGKIRTECGQDIRQFCRGVEPGAGRIVQCLLSHDASLASACRSILPATHATLMPNPSAQSPAPAYQARPAGGNRAAAAGNFRTACGSDVQYLCAGASRENHGIAKCLISHRVELSATCRTFFEQMRARRAAQRTAVAGNPPPATPINREAAAPVGTFRTACGGDVQNLCAGASRENHGIAKCLISHRVELSATCQAFFEQMRARRAAQRTAVASNPPPATPINRETVAPATTFRTACGGDAQSLCAGVSRENHGVAKCLVSHRAELSATCRAFFEQMRARRAERAEP
jgi:hypothetical protein